jgi:hypothetical protein
MSEIGTTHAGKSFFVGIRSGTIQRENGIIII